jgi:DNA polymerase I-like protein with 3'-5' exonuclease and polymerase domains
MHLSRMEANKLGYVETLVGRRGYFRVTTIVNELLEQAGMDYEQFLDMKYRDLKTTYINQVMNKNTLKMILDYLGVSFVDNTGAFRDWGFVQHLYAGELNLSVNFKIQGLAAHIANRAMLEITRGLKEQGLDAWVCLQVHDEITLYARESDVEAVMAVQKKGMETNKYANLLDIPMIADPTVCDNLKDSK